MRLQVDNEYHQVKIKDLNDKYNNTMFTTINRDGLFKTKKQKNVNTKNKFISKKKNC